ncbi:MAG: alanine:cation symporter family protein [Candidatus Eisenbacteria bacterium]|uniref:Alanine:cation symporter family protein n=1 Tax=Eiseniibacteriota bacterium TaxID=2212470 RepID=A0A7Y2ED59_UNCEI|nr:alanine:cation symporter family protein [Candidatus Eisenbacteria bacterium]
MQGIENFVNMLNGYLFSEWVVYALLATGVLFTIWSGFGQYRALTHGVNVIRGKFDDHNDPGAINHFQALSAALSATVGLGNIAGVAVAVALGGPGAVLWMWVIGLIGMSLKMVEVTQSMLYRNTDDPDNPHGGPMFVVRDGFRKWGLGAVGTVIGGIFVISLITGAITGGNMFQAWSVANITNTYFSVPEIVTGIVLAVLVGMVIIGGIKRIGSVAGRIVPLMCSIYLIAGIYVLIANAGQIPSMLALIVKSGLPGALGGETAVPSGAFLGGTFGYAMMWGIKRALFSSEAGQGSSPIAHSAAKTDEPVREGVVAGLEPFIDTIVVCTITALVILSTGAYNRNAETTFAAGSAVSVVGAVDEAGTALSNTWTLETPDLGNKTEEYQRIHRIAPGDQHWREGQTVFMLVTGDEDENTGRNIRTILGTVKPTNGADNWGVDWGTLESSTPPVPILSDGGGYGVYGNYAGPSLTAHAFDRTMPGLGQWLVTLAAWLFAISTMISWSYYGEQGVVYLGGGSSAVMIYKVIYCALIIVTCTGFIKTDVELDMWTTLGLGVMLVANIPLMLIFGKQAMDSYHDYFRRLKAGEMHPGKARTYEDMADD